MNQKITETEKAERIEAKKEAERLAKIREKEYVLMGPPQGLPNY